MSPSFTKTLVIACAIFAGLCATAQADLFRPAYLELREATDGTYQVLWKVPALGDGRRLRASVQWPNGTMRLNEPHVTATNDAWVERYRVGRAGGLVGETITIDNIAGSVTDIIVRVERTDGSNQVERLLPENPWFIMQPSEKMAHIAWAYLVLGVEHILGGIDHLLFVLALLLIVRGTRRIVTTITAFTISHSITLVAATLGWVHLPSAPVEAIIALSIVFVAAEVMRGQQGKPGLTARSPWIAAFGFGLLHGLGFAGALAEVGLPQTAIPLALFMFNIGVELGQLLFVLVILTLAAAGKRLLTAQWQLVKTATSYLIGAVAAAWTIERVLAF